VDGHADGQMRVSCRERRDVDLVPSDAQAVDLPFNGLRRIGKESIDYHDGHTAARV
jgi:hypothetical protein